MAIDQLIGRDPCGRPVAIHRTMDDAVDILYAGHIHHEDGTCTWGILSLDLDDFTDIQPFPPFADIWSSPSYALDGQVHRIHVYAAACFHALSLP